MAESIKEGESDLTMTAKQYGAEVHNYWQAEFFKVDELAEYGYHAPKNLSPKYNREITPEHAAKIAKERGFDTFEIIKTTEEIRRFEVVEVSEAGKDKDSDTVINRSEREVPSV